MPCRATWRSPSRGRTNRVIEGLPPVEKAEIEAAMKELKELVEQYCGGACMYSVLEKGNPEMAI